MHSFYDKNGIRWTACCECNRGGLGNDRHPCAAGGTSVKWDQLGCFIGTPIEGKPKDPPKLTRGQQRYQHYLSVADAFESFGDYLKRVRI